MLRAGNHAPEAGGTRKSGQCWVASSRPSVLPSSVPERQRHTLTEPVASIEGQEGGTEREGGAWEGRTPGANRSGLMGRS